MYNFTFYNLFFIFYYYYFYYFLLPSPFCSKLLLCRDEGTAFVNTTNVKNMHLYEEANSPVVDLPSLSNIVFFNQNEHDVN